MKIGLFDIEANGFIETVTNVWCAVVKELGKDEVTVFNPDNIADLPVYLSTFDVLIAHNGIAYDFPVLGKIFNWEYRGKKVDTLLMSRLQRPDRVVPLGCPSKAPHSIEAWGWRLGRKKVAHEDWSRFSEAMLHRCIEDVHILEEVYNALLEEGRGEGWGRAHRLNANLFHYLQKQTEYGWYIDRRHLDNCLATLDRWINRIDSVVVPRLPIVVEIQETKKDGEYNFVRKPFNRNGTYSAITDRFLKAGDNPILDMVVVGPFSRISFRSADLDKNAEVKQILLSLGWEPDEWNESNGIRTTPKLSKSDSFNGISGGLGRLIARRIQCKQRRGVLEGWAASIREDGRITTRVAGIATTGRLKHSEVVNVPSPHSKAFFAKQMRQVFSAQPGWVMVGTDSKGNQIRQLAARMGDDDFTKAVLHGNSADGTDIHTLNQQRSGAKTRNLAKNFFYGLIFGAGDAKIGKIIDGNAAAGKALKEQYFREMPKLKDFLDRAAEEWRATAERTYNKRYKRMEYKNGYIRGLDGRPILVENEHTILVYYLQSDEAIQMGTAYVMLNKWLERAGYIYGQDYGFLIWMHDEWQLECRPEIVDHVIALSNEAIAWAGRFYGIPVPHEGESKVGRNWYETH